MRVFFFRFRPSERAMEQENVHNQLMLWLYTMCREWGNCFRNEFHYKDYGQSHAQAHTTQTHLHNSNELDSENNGLDSVGRECKWTMDCSLASLPKGQVAFPYTYIHNNVEWKAAPPSDIYTFMLLNRISRSINLKLNFRRRIWAPKEFYCRWRRGNVEMGVQSFRKTRKRRKCLLFHIFTMDTLAIVIFGVYLLSNR